LAKKLAKSDNLTVSIDFVGTLNSVPEGFFLGSYVDVGGNTTQEFAATQFGHAGARQSFPCFDEPYRKALFQVNLGRQLNMTSLSNMPKRIESDPMRDNDVYVWDVYQGSI
jgi:aminopeptidase N